MSDPSATAFARCTAVILFEQESDNMTGDWLDCIVCSRTMRGHFAVYGRKWAEEYSRGRYKKKWFTIFSKKGIRTPAGIVSAIKDCEVELSVEVSWLEVVAKIEKLDPNIAREVENLIEC